MGLRSALNLSTAALAPSTPTNNVRAIRSPWSESTLATIVWSDIYGSAEIPVTRAEAMSVPSVAKGRHLICGLSRLPLRAYRDATQIDAAPWMYRTDGQVPTTTRNLWTLDDLVFSGWSLWARDNGADGSLLDAARVPPERWHFDADGNVLVNEQEVQADQVILFSGPFEGLLVAGAATVRAAKNLERAWAKRVRTPVPVTELHQTTEDPLDEDEVHAMVDEWGRMMDEGGGVAFTPHGIEAKYPSAAPTDLFESGRDAVTRDVGRLLSVSATLLDASLATASLTYTTTEGVRDRFITETAAFWLTQLEARLSMDDVVPRGTRVAFDLGSISDLPSPPAYAPSRED